MASKLRGQELLDYVAENPGVVEKDLVIGAGYVSWVTDRETNEARPQVHTKQFYQELAMAKGVILPATVGRSAKAGRVGKGLSYLLKSNPKSGNVVITGGYTEQIGLTPGEKVTVEVIEEAGEIVIKKAEQPAEVCDSAPRSTREELAVA